MSLNTSSLLCDCNIRWFAEWLNEKNIVVNAICSYPAWLSGANLLEVPVSNFTWGKINLHPQISYYVNLFYYPFFSIILPTCRTLVTFCNVQFFKILCIYYPDRKKFSIRKSLGIMCNTSR